MARSIDTWLSTPLSRRALLRAGVTGGLALYGVPPLRVFAWPTPDRLLRFQATPFSLGVASGDPTADGVVLWTRLAPDPLNGGGMSPEPVTVTWEVAHDDRFARIAKTGRTTATARWGHSVHIEVQGLQPDRWYFYRFRAGSDVSPTGRTRTMPSSGVVADRLRFAFASCQHFEQGYFTAYKHMAAEDVDLLFFLGDYIYENPGTPDRVRKHTGPEIETLADYRNRYALYRSDPHVQQAHAAFPWVVTWDDHEVDNNYADDTPEGNAPREQFLLRRAAAYQAYYEHMPLRQSSVPRGPMLDLYRQLSYGGLASFFVLDTRQYRSDQPCADGTKPACDAIFDPKATALGAPQERWLTTGLDRSRAAWNIVPQQIMMARVDQVQIAPGPPRFSMDQWTGYEAERQRLLSFLATRRPANPVILTGDIHSSWVNDLQVNATDAASPVVATEFVATSISSGGDGTETSSRIAAVLDKNPFVKYYNGQRGYVSVDLTPTSMRAKYQGVDIVTKPDAPLRTRAEFVVETGRPGAVKA